MIGKKFKINIIQFICYEKEDFGQTFGKWGAGEGWYLFLPVLVPSTAIDALGSLGNYMGG